MSGRRSREVQPRGLRREQAANYLGISTSTFDDWVKRGLMPLPKRIDSVVVWDRFQLDASFDAIQSGETKDEVDTWADVG